MSQIRIEIVCEYCGRAFIRRLDNYRRNKRLGRKQYCSNHCASKANPTKERDPVTRFWAKVKKTDTCWVWTAGTSYYGYGSFHYMGKQVSASRFSYILHYGDIPDGMDVLHKCDNPPCARPDHLFLGTNLDNTQDMMAKGRWRGGGQRGERNGSAKLTSADVIAIHARLAKGDKNKDIAKDLFVASSTISEIKTGKYWSHLHS